MTLFTKAVAASADDGSFDAGSGTGFSATGTNFVVGDASASVYNKSVFLRFTGVTIPQGATITAASLSIPATGGSVTPLQTVHIRAEAADNPAAVTSRVDGIGRTKTTAQTSWSGMTAISSGSYTTADIAAVIQEVVNRGGWASGNALQLFLSSDSTSFGTAWQIAFANFNSGTSSPATLSVTYSVGTDYMAGPAEAEGITDAALDALDGVRTQSDPVGATDLAQVAAVVARAVADPVGLTDSLTGTIGASVLVADTVGMTDSSQQLPASLSKSVAAGADDGSFDVVGAGYSNTGTNFVVGDSSGTVYNKSVFLRFTGITIPQGATVTGAQLTIPATGGSVTPLQTVFIRAEAADNPAAVTSRADGIARTKTTAATPWSGMTALASGSYTTPDLSAVLQEVVNRAGWANGNAVQLFLSSDSTSFGTAWQIAFANFNSATSAPATLDLTYSLGGGMGVMRAQADPVGLTDALSPAIAAPRAQGDPVAITDTATASLSTGSNPSDALAVTDAVTADNGRQVDDGVGLSDSAVAVFLGTHYAADLTDSVGVFDADQEQALDLGESFPEEVGVTDTTTFSTTGLRAQPDPVGVADAAAAAADRDRLTTDAVGLTDSISVVMSRIVTVADFLTLTDAPGIDFVSVPPDIITTFGDVEPISDAASWTGDGSRSPADPVAIQDSAVAVLERVLTATPTDPVGLTDDLATTLEQILSAADVAGIRDTVKAELGSLADIPPACITGYRLRADTVTARLFTDTTHGGI